MYPLLLLHRILPGGGYFSQKGKTAAAIKTLINFRNKKSYIKVFFRLISFSVIIPQNYPAERQ
jgi:hypothetical protein